MSTDLLWYATLEPYWDKKNKKQLSEYTRSSTQVAFWRCPDQPEEHFWECSILLMRQRKNKCLFCAGRLVNPTYNAATECPHLLEEYSAKNPRALEEFSPKSSSRVLWQCKRNPKHEWTTTIYHRAIDGTGCPHCSRAGTSLLELRVFSEIKGFFPDAEHRSKSLGVEADILIPSIKVAVEIDGSKWHQNTKRDLKKNADFSSLGISVIRAREKPLTPLGTHDVCHPMVRSGGQEEFCVVLSLLTSIVKISLGKHLTTATLAKYSQQGVFANDTTFQEMRNALPLPLLGCSLAETHPDVSGILSKKSPLKAHQLTAGSGETVIYDCMSCGSPVTTRLQNLVNTIEKKTQALCRSCNSKLRIEKERDCLDYATSISRKFPEIMSCWSSNNTLDPTCLTESSGEVVLFVCQRCSDEFPRRVAKASLLYKSKGNVYCKDCSIATSSTHALPSSACSLAALFPDVVSRMVEPDAKLAIKLFPQSQTRVTCRCEMCGELVTRSVQHFTKSYERNGRVCCVPCSYAQRASTASMRIREEISNSGQNVAELVPELLGWVSVRQKVDLMSVKRSSPRKLMWVCQDCGEEVCRTVASVCLSWEKGNGVRCKKCAAKRAHEPEVTFEDSLAFLYPKIAELVDASCDVRVDAILPQSNKVVCYFCQDCHVPLEHPVSQLIRKWNKTMAVRCRSCGNKAQWARRKGV